MHKICIGAITALTLVSAASANLVNWSFTAGQAGGNYGQNNNGGAIQGASSSFNSATNQFSFSVQFSNQITRGFWLAVSPGDNPKSHSGELALIYFDASVMGNLRMSVYNYNGVNGDTSYYDGSIASGTQAPDRIVSTLNGFAASMSVVDSGGGRTMSISFDATAIQNHVPIYPGNTAWTGVGFGQQIGVWFHPVASLATTYGANGFLSTWNASSGGWLDGHHFNTVPTPAASALLAMAGVGLTRRRRA